MTDSTAADENEKEEVMTILLVDENRDDLQTIVDALKDTVSAEVFASRSPEGAMKAIHKLDRLDFFIAGIPQTNGEEVFTLRDELREKFGKKIPGAFCSHSDMSAYYDRVQGERLFYKPIDDEFLKNWVTEITGKGNEPELRIDDTASVNPQELAKNKAESSASTNGGLPETELPVGTLLGDYKLLRCIQSDDNIAMYEAEQTSINRRVALKTLFRRHRKDPAWVGAFVGEARARALVNHPEISLVYEAAQDFGVNYYTLELIEGPSLAEMGSKKSPLDDLVIRRVLRSCADSVAYLRANQMRHRPVSAESVFLIGDGQPRIANPVKGGSPNDNAAEADQMKLIGEAVSPFVRTGQTDTALATLINRTLDPERGDGINTARKLQLALEELDSNDSGFYYETPEQAEKRSNKMAVIVGGVVGALIVAGGIIAILFAGGGAKAKEFDYMIRIPEGSFIYGENEEIDLPTFWIDEFEVTIGQYATFLDAIADDPEILKKINHPDQPEEKANHIPPQWEKYYPPASKGRSYGGSPIDLNCPVMQVDWWDAYAYAKWKGARLPTEQEWEKAARGREGNIYPWGNELKLSAMNSGDPDGDPFQYWTQVDAPEIAEDSSRYGVRGMAGNVSEWTDTWDTHPDYPDQRVPIRRGGNYTEKEEFKLTARRPAEDASEAKLITGFRTVRDREPIQ